MGWSMIKCLASLPSLTHLDLSCATGFLCGDVCVAWRALTVHTNRCVHGRQPHTRLDTVAEDEGGGGASNYLTTQ